METNQLIGAMWLSIALLAAGFARTRNRSAWSWFLLTLFLGPIAVFLLVVWPALPAKENQAEPIDEDARR